MTLSLMTERENRYEASGPSEVVRHRSTAGRADAFLQGNHLKRKVSLRRQLNTFDVTSLVVGSIIGADVYVAAALGARLVGPASLLLWFAAGLMAIVIALSFSYCAAALPKVGGPYAYVKEVAGPFSGFAVGWSLLIAEWLSLAVFPVAFTQYFLSLIPEVGPQYQVLLKAVFVVILFVTNVFGIRLAGKFNDALTIGKLAPLIILMGLGTVFIGLRPEAAFSNFQPFLRGDVRNLGQALVLIFWAYAGFELSSLPADEIQQPRRTIPRAIAVGMLGVAGFYLLTNFVIIGVVEQEVLASSSAPLMVAGATVFGLLPSLAWLGSLIVGVGALVSIMGADESGTIGTSRLAFAMSIDGLLPRMFSKLHKSLRTPFIGLAVICSTAFIASVLGTLSALINASVFLLSFAYLATCISAILLERKRRERSRRLSADRFIATMGILFSILLMSQVDAQQILISLVLMAVGVPVYTFFSPKEELKELQEVFLSREAILERTYHQGEIFLGYAVRRFKWLVHRARKIGRAWMIERDVS